MNKFLSIFIILSGSFLHGFAQSTDSLKSRPDSARSKSKQLMLSISNPQPRMNEKFQITLDMQPVKVTILQPLAGQVTLSGDRGPFSQDNGDLIMNVTAVKKGKNEIGPLTFTLDSIQYTTNKITYEVVDALPETENGVWFRAVRTSDSTFIVIIEQRSSGTMKDDPTTEVVKFKKHFALEGAQQAGTNTKSNYEKITVKDVPHNITVTTTVQKFVLDNKHARILITEDMFENLPKDYKFEPLPLR